MQLDQYVDELRGQLLAAASAGSDETRETAERLTLALDAATRLVLLDALAAATGEITRELAPGSVELRLRGREPEFVVAHAGKADEESPGPSAALPSGPAPVADGPAIPDPDDVSTSRTTLRLPDQLKGRLEAAAAADGVSLNSWIVRALASALEPRRRRSSQREQRGDQFAGWVR